MPYTLAKGFVWVLLALLLGFVIGWVLRSITARRQVARARAHHVETAELERLRRRAADLESAAAERDRIADPADTPSNSAPVPRPERSAGEGLIGMPDDAGGARLADAERVLGQPVHRDDLKVIVGIGPNIEELCSGIGISTWRDLAETEVSLLATMLEDAGARFRNTDPASWPDQAELLASERWGDFAELVAELNGNQSGK